MAQWTLGYINNLDHQTTYDAGMAMYDPFGATVLALDNNNMCRAVGYKSSSTSCSSIVNYPNMANVSIPLSYFESGEFIYGFIRMLSGSDKNKVVRVTSNSSSSLYYSGSLAAGYFEVVSGSCKFTFPDGRNPIRRDFKRMVKQTSERFPFYGGGLVFAEGYQPDDFSIMTYFTDKRDADRLELMMNHLLDYKGMDALYSVGIAGDNSDGLAPMILQTGENDVFHQFLVFVSDYKIVKDAKKSDDFYEILLHFQNFASPLYRGI